MKSVFPGKKIPLVTVMGYKFRITFFLIGPVLAAALFNSPVLASAVSAGRVVSVSSDYALDATRNPALLTFRGEGRSVSVMALYRPYNGTFSDGILTNGTVNLPVNFRSDRHISGELLLGYIRNYGDFAFGMGLGGAAAGQFLMTKDEISFGLNSTKGENTSINPSFYLSFAARISPNDGAGVQLITSYASTKGLNEDISLSPPKSYSDSETSGNAISASLVFGYYRKMDRSAAGIMIRAGTLTAERTEYRVNYVGTVFGTPNTPASDTSVVPFRMMYMLGPSLVAGAHSMLFGFLGVCVEVDVSAPVVFRRQTATFLGNLGSYFKGAQRYSVKPIVVMRGGFDIHVNRWTLVNLGGGLVNSLLMLDGNIYENKDSTQRTLAYYATLGVDYRLTGGITLTAGALYSRSSLKTDTIVMPAGFPVFFRSNSTVHSVDIHLGMTLGM